MPQKNVLIGTSQQSFQFQYNPEDFKNIDNKDGQESAEKFVNVCSMADKKKLERIEAILKPTQTHNPNAPIIGPYLYSPKSDKKGGPAFGLGNRIIKVTNLIPNGYVSEEIKETVLLTERYAFNTLVKDFAIAVLKKSDPILLDSTNGSKEIRIICDNLSGGCIAFRLFQSRVDALSFIDVEINNGKLEITQYSQQSSKAILKYLKYIYITIDDTLVQLPALENYAKINLDTSLLGHSLACIERNPDDDRTIIRFSDKYDTFLLFAQLIKKQFHDGALLGSRSESLTAVSETYNNVVKEYYQGPDYNGPATKNILIKRCKERLLTKWHDDALSFHGEICMEVLVSEILRSANMNDSATHVMIDALCHATSMEEREATRYLKTYSEKITKQQQMEEEGRPNDTGVKRQELRKTKEYKDGLKFMISAMNAMSGESLKIWPSIWERKGSVKMTLTAEDEKQGSTITICQKGGLPTNIHGHTENFNEVMIAVDNNIVMTIPEAIQFIEFRDKPAIVVCPSESKNPAIKMKTINKKLYQVIEYNDEDPLKIAINLGTSIKVLTINRSKMPEDDALLCHIELHKTSDDKKETILSKNSAILSHILIHNVTRNTYITLELENIIRQAPYEVTGISDHAKEENPKITCEEGSVMIMPITHRVFVPILPARTHYNFFQIIIHVICNYIACLINVLSIKNADRKKIMMEIVPITTDQNDENKENVKLNLEFKDVTKIQIIIPRDGREICIQGTSIIDKETMRKNNFEYISIQDAAGNSHLLKEIVTQYNHDIEFNETNPTLATLEQQGNNPRPAARIQGQEAAPAVGRRQEVQVEAVQI